jgi:transposase InsO family protein
MHRTLKAATTRPPQAHLAAQQRAFNRFRVLYNEERPHQYLDALLSQLRLTDRVT